MFDGTQKVFRDLLTGVDGKTHDIGRYLAVGGGVWGIGGSMYDVLANHVHFDMQAFGVGMAALAGGIGALLHLKKDTEPPAPPSV